MHNIGTRDMNEEIVLDKNNLHDILTIRLNVCMYRMIFINKNKTKYTMNPG